MRTLLATLALLLAASAHAAAPLKVVEDSLEVPAGMSAEEALSVVEDLPGLFARYEPVVPRVPGVSLDLGKEVVSPEVPVVLALPVDGAVFGRDIAEQALVTASTEAHLCGNGADGLRIDLSFTGSSHNVARRVDRIEITACPRAANDGTLYIDTRGALYEGALPIDPALNGFNESVGAKALQSAFLKQVPAVFEAVEQTWAARQPTPR